MTVQRNLPSHDNSDNQDLPYRSIQQGDHGSGPHSLGAGHPAARGFAQILGLHPAVAFLTLVVDTMLSATDLLTAGVGSVLIACVVGGVAYRAQKKWYGDDNESAAIKAVILTLLVAIPTPIPALAYVPAGVVGIFRRKIR